MLLTHGYGASQAMWAPNLDVLGRDRRVLTWDLPGHGAGSPSGELSRDRCIADMLALLDMLDAPHAVLRRHVPRLRFLSLLFHARHPERVAALLLVDSGPGFRDGVARGAMERLGRGVGGKPRGPRARGTGSQSGVGGRRSRLRRHGPGRSCQGHPDSQRDGEVIESLGSIGVPTLIVVGARDERFLTAAEVMARRIPGARKLVIEDAGHAANMDQPAALNRAVCEFLEGL